MPFSNTLLFMIFFVMFGISFCNGFFNPVKGSLVKKVVGEKERVKANSLLASIDQTFLFAGWTFGGVLLAWLGSEVTLLIILSFILVSIFSMQMVNEIAFIKVESGDGLKTPLTAGWRYLFQHSGLRTLVLMDVLEAFVGTIWIGAVTLTYVDEALGKGEAWWGYINGAYYVGMIIGGLLIYTFSKRMNQYIVFYMVMGSALFGILTFWYGVLSHPYMALLFVVLMGPAYQLRDLCQETLYQNSLSEELLTKVLAAKSALIQIVFIISMICIGFITDLFGVHFVYVFSGCILLCSAGYGFVELLLRKKEMTLKSEVVRS